MKSLDKKKPKVSLTIHKQPSVLSNKKCETEPKEFMKSLDKGKGIKENNCPSPENPCMCDCHTRENECWECRMGRHKPMNQKSLDKQNWEKRFDEGCYKWFRIYPDVFINIKGVRKFIQSELNRQKKEILKEIEKLETDSYTLDGAYTNEVISKIIKSLKKGEQV